MDRVSVYGNTEILESVQAELERLVEQRLHGPFTTEQTRRYAELTQLEDRLLRRSA
jgi:hypothetical protein